VNFTRFQLDRQDCCQSIVRSISFDDNVRATAVGRGAERDAVLAGDPKGLVYYVMID